MIKTPQNTPKNSTPPKKYDEDDLVIFLEQYTVRNFVFVLGSTALNGAHNYGFVDEFIQDLPPEYSLQHDLAILALNGMTSDMDKQIDRLDKQYGLEVFRKGICRIKNLPILLIISAFGMGQGKSITAVFDPKFESFRSHIKPFFKNIQNICNLAKIPKKPQAIITSNGMTGFSTELCMFIFNEYPRKQLDPNFAIYIIEDTDLSNQSDTHKLDLAFKNYLRIAHPNYCNISLKMIPISSTIGGINYNPYKLIVFNLQALQLIADPGRYSRYILLSNDITDIQRFGVDCKAAFDAANKEKGFAKIAEIFENCRKKVIPLLFDADNSDRIEPPLPPPPPPHKNELQDGKSEIKKQLPPP